MARDVSFVMQSQFTQFERLTAFKLMVRETAWKRTKAYIRRMRANKAGGWIALLLLLLLDKKVEASQNVNETVEYRLPKNVIPSSYEIKFAPHDIQNNLTYDGEAVIVIHVKEELYDITLHAHEGLRIDETATNLTASNGTTIKPKCHKRVNETDFLTLNFRNKIDPGNYTLRFKFIGNISEESIGIYKSSYINEKNEKVSVIATHMSPIKARRAFPCWDEPALKATFNISIKHFSNYTASSNMQIRNKTEACDGKIWTNFEPTPIMSTYLVAFVISDFNCTSNENKSFNICARKKILPEMKFVHEIGQKAFSYLIQYTKIPYSLPKIDNYAIADAKPGGMENWGLATYRESNIGINNGTPCSAKEAAAELVIHELAHQWFGNLVSPAWWKYLWLKEGLAKYFQFYIGSQVFPEWDLKNMFVVRILQTSTFAMDSTTHYNYLNWEPKSPAEIKSQFSSMTYHKSAVIVHLLNNILSNDVFQEGIRIYLKKHQYSVATADDFWQAMQESYEKSTKQPSIKIKDVMEPWTEQKGYPIVKVIRNYETGKATINQTCNLISEQSNRWCIPINYATKSNLNFESTGPSHWLKPHDVNLSIEGIDKDDWLILNIQQSGYYRVDYDNANWEKIANYLDTDDYKKIHVLNRGQLINDLSYLATNDQQNYTTFLELTKYLSREVDLIPWRHATNAFRLMKRKVIDKEFQTNLKKYVLGLMNKLIAEIGFEEKINDSYIIKKKRAEFLPFVCDFNHTECILIAEKKLTAFIDNSTANPIPPNLEPWILCSGAVGSKNEQMLHKKIENGEYKYFKYLGCMRNKTFVRQYIEKALMNSTLPKNNTRMALGFISNDGPENWEYAVDYYTKNFDRIVKYFNNTTYTSSTLSDYIWRTPTPEHMKKISEFVDKNNEQLTPWVKTAIPQQIKKLKWAKDNAPILIEWIEKQKKALKPANFGTS